METMLGHVIRLITRDEKINARKTCTVCNVQHRSRVKANGNFFLKYIISFSSLHIESMEYLQFLTFVWRELLQCCDA